MAARKKVEDPKMTVSSDPPADTGVVHSSRAGGGGHAGGAAGGGGAVKIGTPAAAPAFSAGYYMGIKIGVPDAAAHAAALGTKANTASDIGWVLGTVAPRAGWPA